MGLPRLTGLEELKHDHVTRIVSGLRGLSFERPLSTTNNMADQRNTPSCKQALRSYDGNCNKNDNLKLNSALS